MGVSQRCENDRIDLIAAIDPLLQVRDARPILERRVTQRRKSVIDLGPQGLVDGEPVGSWRFPEECLVEAEEASQLLDRLPVVVGTEVDERVGEPGVAAVPLDDEQRRRLLATAIASRCLGGGEAVEEPFSERAARASTVARETRMFPWAA